MVKIKKESEIVQVTFNQKQLNLIRKFKGIFGNKETEIVRYIVANWLLENANKIKENQK